VARKSDKELFLTISLVLREETPWAGLGHEVAWFQHLLSKGEGENHTISLQRNPNLLSSSFEPSPLWVNRYLTQTVISDFGDYPPKTALDNGEILRTPVRKEPGGGLVFDSERPIYSPGFSFTFDEARGYLTRWAVGGIPLLEPDPFTGAAIIPSFWRAPTDNDNPHSLPYWKRFGVDNLTSQLRSFSTFEDSNGVTVRVVTFLSPPVLAWGFETTTTYTISHPGKLAVDVHLIPTGSIPTHLPRVGLNLRLPRRFECVKWQGLGPGEAYPDKRSAQRMGVWSVDSIAELQTPYEVPQENGNRMATRWVKVLEPQGTGIRAVAGESEYWSDNCEREFSWAASRHSTRVLQDAKHPCDLVEQNATLLRLDARVAGVGTAACGPGVRKDLLVKVEEMRFSFVLEAVGI